MRIELDEDATRAAEKGAGQLGMSVNGYVNWVVACVEHIEVVETSAVTIRPQPPVNAPVKIARRRKSWVVNI